MNGIFPPEMVLIVAEKDMVTSSQLSVGLAAVIGKLFFLSNSSVLCAI